MRGNLVNLNVNPCKMCMPMGAVTACYGIKKCMSILHGSQGCSTYIRRHMATHYNEPVDIASSSLTEEGTVYGGEQNLLKGLKNLITIYKPEVIAVETTCLAETIGEDINRIIDKFRRENPEANGVEIISIPSAGYAGTQFEGYMKALHSIVSQVQMEENKNNKINVITAPLSPGDTRYLKELLESFSLEYILLPDLSENLDGVYQPEYEKLPSKGTDIRDIRKMGGAAFTIEISSFTEENPSVAEYLFEEYQVPYEKCNLPVSLRDNDTLIRLLASLSGKEIPDKLKKERGRFLDAMIDAHKYNGEARAAVFGEPDFVYSTVRLCVENGVLPVLVATGSKCPSIIAKLTEEIKEVADRYFVEDFEILSDTDFKTIEEKARELSVNVLIGNSDGRRISENLKIELVRRSFPIHDRVGGQRLRTIGYNGALTFLDDISNVILAGKETGFRKELYAKYFKEGLQKGGEMENKNNQSENLLKEKRNVWTEANINESLKVTAEATDKTPEEKSKTHPCFNCGAHDYARMHLPIAPKCNISCNYCVRKYDCPNESRPGVTTQVLNPEEAYEKYLYVKKKVSKLSVIGIAGPGDALANFEETKRTLALIRQEDKDVTFCLSTNGLMLPQYAEELIALGVSHITVTMNAVDPKIGAKIYRHVNYMGNSYFGETAAAILMSNQMAGIKMLASRGIVCKVNIVMIKGINDEHIPEVVQKVKDLGAAITNIMQLIPVEGSVFEKIPLVSNQEIMAMRKKCGETMKQMYHCKQCRADAIGALGDDRSIEFNACHEKEAQEQQELLDYPETLKQQKKHEETEDLLERNKGIYVAVATKSGVLVDQHFGQVSEFYIFEYKNGTAQFKERRVVEKYCNGVLDCEEKEDKITSILKTISDCTAVVAMRIGESPKSKLEEKGIHVLVTYDRIEDSVKKAISECKLSV
ncbi:nitrogenase cofactor biosynthesis protein NifB [Anaerocolumna sp. AGMB13020]|uniref:nitrogenase cofactor biosynthesis protein NifB n=1 Tax=Anaerocolumna sp. AGMB13020 TaxID=3081750 RepID=UPI0029542465|nr:nitrogenase cofactor biosynthesis protein NifB [Anaerocolumna sp. AGMB13020]WOO37403.1 nitrogenase cofactor biosynthesis protein NifB [Anaerocolumna sp. AGMB13020]